MAAMEARGQDGRVIFDGEVVTITRESRSVRREHGDGDMVIPLRHIIGVTFHTATLMKYGAIRFKIAGEAQPYRFLKGGAAYEAFKDPYGMSFTKKHLADFVALKDAVNSAIVASA